MKACITAAVIVFAAGSLPLFARAVAVDRGGATAPPGNQLLAEELETLPDGARVRISQEEHPTICESLQDRITEGEAGVFARVTERSCEAGCLRAVQTKGGIVAVLDRLDGVVYVNAFALDLENPDLGNVDGPAFSATISREGLEIVSLDEDRLARFLGEARTDAVPENKEGRVAASTRHVGDREAEKVLEDLAPQCDTELLSREFESLPAEGVEWQITQADHPSIYGFFLDKLARGEAELLKSKIQRTRRAGWLHSVWTSGGGVAILDRGDGVLRIEVFAIDFQHPDLGNTGGPALSALISRDGAEVELVDEDRLARFLAAGVTDKRLEPGGVELECNWMSPPGVCCVYATESRICICCATVSPLSIGCMCKMF